MAKDKAERTASQADQAVTATETTLLDLQTDAYLWYKIHVLIYDLYHIKNDHASEPRTLCTTDELYISEPYFTPSEAAMVKSAVFESSRKDEESTDTNGGEKLGSLTIKRKPKTVEDAIKEKLGGFFDKRRACGDSRTCGPHDMAPIYASVFDVKHIELEDAQFLGRLRRSGLDSSTKEEELKGCKKKRKGGKSG